MKTNKLLLGVLASVTLVSGALQAATPTAPANPANTEMSAADKDKCAAIMASFIAKDQRQDAKGQAKLDRAWAAYWKSAGYNTPPYPNPTTYEGSAKDMQQDAKLQAKMNQQLLAHHCPAASPIL